MRATRFVRRLIGAALGAWLFTPAANGQETTRVSVDSAGAEMDGWCWSPAISADGRIVAFASSATNLVVSDTNDHNDVFVHDRSTGTTERVSVSSSGEQATNGSSGCKLSNDGRFVVFYSEASNLVVGDTNAAYDVFVHDRVTGLTERVSVDSTGTQGNHDSGAGHDFQIDGTDISADGRFVLFTSNATNLVPGDTNAVPDVFVRDRATARTERVSVDSAGAEGNGWSQVGSVSADGRFVAFNSTATNLVTGDTNGSQDAFVHNRATGVTERVSVDSAGSQANNYSAAPRISADGRVVLFTSLASNLLGVGGDGNATIDVFVHDRVTGVTERVSVDSTGKEARNGSSDNSHCTSSISADGMTVAFASKATNLVSRDSNLFADVFVHGRATGVTQRVSVDSAGLQSDDNSSDAMLSADGRFVVFTSEAKNLVFGDRNGASDVFVRERCSTDATWTNYGAGFSGTNGDPSFVARVDPMVGTTVPLDLANSYGPATVGVAAFGYSETFVPTSKGGDLLVDPAFWVLVAVPPAGATIEYDIPNDHARCGLELFGQAFELDPGAAKGFSFTPGLKLVLGH